MATLDYYQILNVLPDASSQEIKAAYRRLALRYHPDRNAKAPHPAEKMKQLNEAYAVLSNRAKRQEYDAYRNRFGQNGHRHFRQTYTDHDIFAGSDIHAVFEEMARAFGLRGFEEIFKETNGPGVRTFKVHRPGFFAKGFVFFGSPGNRVDGDSREALPGSLGRFGKYVLKKVLPGGTPEKGADVHDLIPLSPEHAEQGGPYAYYLKPRKKKLVVKIPKGVKDGQQIRLAGLGKKGKHGGPSGDVLLKVKIKTPWRRRIKKRFGKKHSAG